MSSYNNILSISYTNMQVFLKRRYCKNERSSFQKFFSRFVINEELEHTMVYATSRSKIYPHYVFIPGRKPRNFSAKRKLKTVCHINTTDVKKTAQEYAQNSSLHGLRYLGSKDLHVVER